MESLNADIRKTVGNGPARALRREGKIPGILYGPRTESVSLSVNVKSLEQLLKKGKSRQMLFNLAIQNEETRDRAVMIKELQIHPLTRNFLHVDFYEVDMARKIRISIPVKTKGKSKGVEMGGILQVIRRELEVLCLPNEIPDVVEIDVTDLGIGDSVHVKEIDLGDNIEIPAEVNFTVITVVGAKPEAEEISEEEAEEEEEMATSEAEEAVE